MATWLAAGRPAAEVVGLDDPLALDADVVGMKAANLARARRAGLPSLDGFVLPTSVIAAMIRTGTVPAGALAAYDELSDGGRRPVVVRSSAPSEDTSGSSMAGQFHSVTHVRGAEAFADAVVAVAASGGGQPIAVLVQPHVDPAVSGVAFGVDPVSGRPDRRVVAAVRGGPQALVSGTVTGDRYELDRRGRLKATQPGDGDTQLSRADRRALARLTAAAADAFGGPQDIEWARTETGDTLLLQSRPVTTHVERGVGPRFAPGPVAETFPAPLSRLEQELWLPPLRDAIAEVAALTGVASSRRIQRSPVVVSPGGRPAVDLDLVAGTPRSSKLAVFDPRPGIRRLRAAWKVGRIGAAFDAIAGDVVGDADAALADVPEVADLDDASLLTVLDRAVDALRSLHGHEILAGALADQHGDGGGGATGAEVALHVLATARAAGLDDATIRAAHPEVLALSGPRIGPPAPLPADPPMLRAVTVEDLGAREALRLRARWVHELTAVVVRELGHRLSARRLLDTAADVRDLSLDELRAALGGRRPEPTPAEVGPPLPATFRLAADGTVVAEAASGDSDGIGAGGGRGAGPVHVGGDPPPGSVLVVDVLDPGLAAHLPRLAGLVAETGSPLSHLAILAREHGVATVVGVAGALGRWTPGEVVVVDGVQGTVETLGSREVTP